MDGNTIAIFLCVGLSAVFVAGVGTIVFFGIRKQKRQARQKEMLAKIRPSSSEYLEQLNQQPAEESVVPEAMLAENAGVDPQQAADYSEFSGEYYCNFGESNQPGKVFLLLEHVGLLRVTPISIYIKGRLRFRSKMLHSASPIEKWCRIDPEWSSGFYDTKRRIISLRDSAKPWLILQSKATTNGSAAEEFQRLVASLIALMGARMEERSLGGMSAKVWWMGIAGILGLAAGILIPMWMKQGH